MINTEINLDKVYVEKSTFKRPEHPALQNKLTGWIASWKLMQKENTYKQNVIKEYEEAYGSELEAKNALRKYNKQKLIELL